MTVTARLLNLTQPGVSQLIRDVEKLYNVRLFDRLGRKLFLTYSGEVLRDHLLRTLMLQRETARKMDAISKKLDERIRIGASMTPGNYYMPQWISEFRQKQPGIDMLLEIDNTAKIEEGLISSKLDLAIVEGNWKSDLLVGDPLIDDPLFFICAPTHRLCRLKEITLDDMEGERIILREEGSGTRSTVEAVLESGKKLFRSMHTINNFEGIKRAVAGGLGVSFLPERAVRKECDRNELAALPVNEPGFTRTFHLLRHRDKIISEPLKLWTDFLTSVRSD